MNTSRGRADVEKRACQVCANNAHVPYFVRALKAGPTRRLSLRTRRGACSLVGRSQASRIAGARYFGHAIALFKGWESALILESAAFDAFQVKPAERTIG